MRNRRSAAMSRRRKREYVAELEEQIDALKGKLVDANKHLEEARREIRALRGARAEAPSPSISVEAPDAHATPMPSTPDAKPVTLKVSREQCISGHGEGDARAPVPKLRLPVAAVPEAASASPPGQAAVTPTEFAFVAGGGVSPALVAPEMNDREVDVSGVVAFGLETQGGDLCGTDRGSRPATGTTPTHAAHRKDNNGDAAADPRRAKRARTSRWHVHTAHGFQLGLETEPDAIGGSSDALPPPSPGPLLQMDMAEAAEVLRMAWSAVATPSPHTLGRRMFFASNDAFSA